MATSSLDAARRAPWGIGEKDLSMQEAALPQDLVVELTCGVTVAAWQLVVQLTALRGLVQEATGAETPPPVVLHRSAAAQGTQVAIKTAKLGDAAQEVLCSAASIDDLHDKFSKSLEKHSTITFATENDRPGLLAEVTELLKEHGINIVSAEVTTDPDSKRAKHAYTVADAATGGRVQSAVLEQLEADFVSLRDSGLAVRELLRQPTASLEDAGGPAELATDAACNSFLLRITATSRDGWRLAAESASLRESIRDKGRMTALPAVELRVRADSAAPHFEVVRFCPGSAEGTSVCSGPSAEQVGADFCEQIGGVSTLTFRTEQDRPGLLAEVTELLRLHGADIVHAKVSADAATHHAVHVYKVKGASTGRRLSDAALAQLQADFRVLRGAAPKLRRAVTRTLTKELAA